MATVLTFALIVFVYGMLSLVLDRDVIREPDAGPLVGVSMVATTLAVVVVVVVRERPAPVVARTVTVALSVAVLGPLAGAIVYSFVREELGVIPFFFGEYVLSPFVLASAVIAGAVVLGHCLVRLRPGT